MRNAIEHAMFVSRVNNEREIVQLPTQAFNDLVDDVRKGESYAEKLTNASKSLFEIVDDLSADILPTTTRRLAVIGAYRAALATNPTDAPPRPESTGLKAQQQGSPSARGEMKEGPTPSASAQSTASTEIQPDGPCEICGEDTNVLAADPGLWPILHPRRDGTGICRHWHNRCVFDRVNAAAPEPPPKILHGWPEPPKVERHEFGEGTACMHCGATSESEPCVQSPSQDNAIAFPRADTDTHVYFYERDFYPLGNFSAFRIMFGGIYFATSEHAYHYQKFPDHIGLRDAILHAASAHEAFKIAEGAIQYRRADWSAVKADVMRNILRAKVEQHEYVRRKLLATGTRVIVEDSWRDPEWGCGPNGDGKNLLGKLWMEIRAEIQRSMEGESK